MSTGYLWIKAFHVIFVITWMAGLFYLPRLFVYHSSATDQLSRDRFKVMESKLYRIIMRPSMVLATVFGLWVLVLAWEAFAASGWLWLKITAVIALLRDINEHGVFNDATFDKVWALLQATARSAGET